MFHISKFSLFVLTLTCLFSITFHGGNVCAKEGKLTRHTLPNGLEVLIQEDHARKVATAQLWVMVGSADEESSERGISHLIEHMAFKGTSRRGVGRAVATIAVASAIPACGAGSGSGRGTVSTYWCGASSHGTDDIDAGLDRPRPPPWAASPFP